MVKRIIRQNNYHQYEKTHTQCLDLGLNVNRHALDRFANKLELIDKAELSKRQYELNQIEYAKRQELDPLHESSLGASSEQQHHSQISKPHSMEPRSAERAVPQKHKKRVKSGSVHALTYEQVKQRETEITFALGELKIRENELLQELITLTEMLDTKQVN